MSDLLITALVAVGSSLLTIFLTPRVQHHFWKYQKRAEFRLAVINEFNRLTAEFISAHIDAQRTQTLFTPSLEWYTAFSINEANIRGLFSHAAYEAYKQLEVLIGPSTSPGRLGSQGQYGIHDFLDRKDAAMRQLYRELSLG